MLRVQSTPQLHGKPVYKSQEEQYDEIQLLRYRAADLRDDNQLLRAQLAKCREELSKRHRETEKRLEEAAAKSETGSTSGICGGGTNTSTSATVTSLKLRLFRLEQVLKEKEEEVRRLRADTRTVRLKELKLQVQVYYRELLRLRRQLSDRRRDLGPGPGLGHGSPSDLALVTGEARRLRRENRRLKAQLGDTETLPEAIRGGLTVAVKHEGTSRTDLILTVESLEASVRRSEADYQLVLKQSSRHQRAKEEHERQRQREERRREEEERRRESAEREREQYRSAVQRWKRESQAADASLQRQNAELLSRVEHLQEELLRVSSSPLTPSSSQTPSSGPHTRPSSRRREIEMEDVVLSFRRRCAARRIAAGWQRYNNRKKLRQNLSVIRRLARGYLRRVALLEENAAILALPEVALPIDPTTNYKYVPLTEGGAAGAVRTVQSAVRQVLVQAALTVDSSPHS
ncbi:IQ domain-containing protein E [Amphibalanus amphitrite]|uniref:IQ domain-containing protein E n=1 Tax=Amphibalanus amphitrite TaxID=1232801 RepID=A0A6A4V1L7_AMPAM|nr:IQ domain-containing protein E [Amphibalanus amphitrite]